jgi:flavin reductase (DIM6/NTAB) family NADH-FMN oxidoreductase RutF
MVSVSIRPDRFSYGLIRESGVFAVNLVDRPHARALDFCGVRSGRDTDKLAACHLQAVPMEGVPGAWGLDGFPVTLGCEVRQVIPLGSHDLFLGEIRQIRVREDLFSADGAMHLDRAGLVTYSHGVYQETGEAFGFFGWSVAKEETFRRRMEGIRNP